MGDQIFELKAGVAKAVSHYWRTREAQAKKQAASGRPDYGAEKRSNRRNR